MIKKSVLVFILAFAVILGGAAFAEVPKEAENQLLLTDETWDGDYLLTHDLDLNGHALVINGNLILHKGALKINGGSLIVNGDFRIQGIKKNGDGVDYAQLTEDDFQFCSGQLRMDKDVDRVQVNGNFYPNGKDNQLRAGVVELKGDFISNTNAYADSYVGLGKHKTIFSGEGDQTVVMVRAGNSSQFNVLSVKKKNGKMLFKTTVDVRSIDEDTVIPVAGNGYIYLYNRAAAPFDLKGKKLTIDGTMFIDRSMIAFNGGMLEVTKDLRVQKIRDVSKKMDIEYGQLVPEDFLTATSGSLSMKNEKDRLLVWGNAYFQDQQKASQLRAGVMEFKGNFSALSPTVGGFLALDKSKAIFTGKSEQTIYFTAPSYIGSNKKVVIFNQFNMLDIQNKNTKLRFSEKVNPKTTKVIAKTLLPKNFKFK